MNIFVKEIRQTMKLKTRHKNYLKNNGITSISGVAQKVYDLKAQRAVGKLPLEDVQMMFDLSYLLVNSREELEIFFNSAATTLSPKAQEILKVADEYQKIKGRVESESETDRCLEPYPQGKNIPKLTQEDKDWLDAELSEWENDLQALKEFGMQYTSEKLTKIEQPIHVTFIAPKKNIIMWMGADDVYTGETGRLSAFLTPFEVGDVLKRNRDILDLNIGLEFDIKYFPKLKNILNGRENPAYSAELSLDFDLKPLMKTVYKGTPEIGKKEKDGKPDYAELDWDFIETVAQRMSSNDKYTSDNWQKPMCVKELAKAAMRHARKILQPIENDPETIADHAAALGANGMMIHYQTKKHV